MTAATAVQWATLKYSPTEAKPSQKNPDWAPQHSALVTLGNGEETRIYFAQGEFSYLEKNDQVMVAWDKGRWRLGKTQTPDLMAVLAQRQQQRPQQPDNVVPIREGQSVPPQKEKPSKERIEAYVSSSMRLFRHCWNEAAASLPETCTTEDVRKVASTLFIAAQRKFGL